MSREALRDAFAALQAGRFTEARRLAGPYRGSGAGAVLHALALAGDGEVAAGAAALHAVARANPGARHPVYDLMGLLRGLGRGGEAAGHLRAALGLAPSDAGLAAALGAALAEDGCAAEAADIFGWVAARRPEDWDAAANHGKALAAVGRFVEAEAVFARVPPGDAQRDLNRAVAVLKSGRLAEGWGLFRARHGLPGRKPGPQGLELRGLAGVAGASVSLLHDEGFGDTFQFIRYAPMLARLGTRVRVVAPEPLRRVLEGQGLAVDVRYAGGTWCRIPDLPGVFGTTLETVPGTLPYLRPDPALVAAWGARLPPGRRVGLVWAGAARTHDAGAMATDRVRSIPQEALGPLLGVPGVSWVSLQQGRAAPDRMFDPMPRVVDFADTAAIIAGLDLVVSVDTSVAHLAAAMGVRVVLMDRFDNCWRWLSGREDSPWYPGVLRIVRQEQPGDWGGVLARVAALVAAG